MFREELHRLIIENQSEDGSIDISDQKAMADEICALIHRVDNDAHLIGFKNGKFASVSFMKGWVKNKAPVTNIQNIEPLKNGQYIKVDNILAAIATLEGTEGTK